MSTSSRTPVLPPTPFSEANDDGVKLVLYSMTGGTSENAPLTHPHPQNTTNKADSVSEYADCVCLERVGDNGHCTVHGGLK